MSLGMSYKPNIHKHVPGTSVNQASAHSQSPNLATLQSFGPVLSDFGTPSLGIPQSTSGTQVPQNKYSELLGIIEELGKEIRPTYAGSKTAMERLKRGSDVFPLKYKVFPYGRKYRFVPFIL